MLDRLSERLHPQELIKLRAAAEAKPLPTPQAPKPLGWGRAMIDYLNAEAPVEPRTLGMQRPTPPMPRRNPLASPLGAEHALDRLSCVVGVYLCIGAELESALAELAALAPLVAKAEVA